MFVSFNRITVDGDTSTNDACVLAATGQSAASVESTEDSGYAALRDAVTEVATRLAQAIVRDGEGATNFVTVEVVGGGNRGRVRTGGIRHRPLASGEDRVFRRRPELGPYLGGGGPGGHPSAGYRARVHLSG